MSCGVVCGEKESSLGQSYGVHRTYKQWNNWSGVAKEIQRDHAAGRLPWVSFKPPLQGAAGWSGIADGKYDADIKALATTLKANDDKPLLVTFHHEPSNDGTEDEGKLWAAAYVHIHDLLKAEGALGPNVSDPPILQDWIFNPTNRLQDPINWATDEVLERVPFMGIDMYQNSSGETFAVRIPRIIDWMADRGYPNMMVGIGETGSTGNWAERSGRHVAERLAQLGRQQHRQGRRRVLLQLDRQLGVRRLLAARRERREDGRLQEVARPQHAASTELGLSSSTQPGGIADLR